MWAVSSLFELVTLWRSTSFAPLGLRPSSSGSATGAHVVRRNKPERTLILTPSLPRQVPIWGSPQSLDLDQFSWSMAKTRVLEPQIELKTRLDATIGCWRMIPLTETLEFMPWRGQDKGPLRFVASNRVCTSTQAGRTWSENKRSGPRTLAHRTHNKLVLSPLWVCRACYVI